MTQIEELGKAIAQIIYNRKANTEKKTPELVEMVYDSLRLEPDFLLDTPLPELRNYLNQEDMGGLQRMEIAAKLLIEEAYLHPEKRIVIRQKAKEMLEYIQDNDTTFSLERIQLLEELGY
jgi:hypothetical protein